MLFLGGVFKQCPKGGRTETLASQNNVLSRAEGQTQPDCPTDDIIVITFDQPVAPSTFWIDHSEKYRRYSKLENQKVVSKVQNIYKSQGKQLTLSSF